MLSNYEVNGALNNVSNVQVNVASQADIGQRAQTSSLVTAFWNTYSNKASNDERSDIENDECCTSKESISKLNAENYPYSHNSNGGAIKRGIEVVENENDEDSVTLSSTGCSRRSPPKKPKFVVTSAEMNEFFKLLHLNEVQHFLKRDSCCLISDKYALAMVFTYFKRAKFNLQEYTLEHFYLALYLASDIEEDVDEYKYEIFPWALGSSWRSNFSGFLRKRDALLRRIGYRAIVSRKCCEEVMSFRSDHTAWKRERAEDHGGATRAYLINRSKRFLSVKNNLDDEDLNYPRMSDEAPRPCPLCLINRGWNSSNNSINLAISSSILKPTHKLSNITNTFNMHSSNTSLISTTDGSIIDSTLNISPKKKVSERNCAAKRQKQSTIISNVNKEASCMLIKPKSSLSSIANNHHVEKSCKPLNKTPKKSITKPNLATVSFKSKHQQKQTDEIDANLLKLGALDTARELKLKTGAKLPASNKFNKNKLSITELENNHRGFELPRRSSLASSDKLLIKDNKTSDEDNEDNSCYDDDDDDDDTTDEVFSNEKPIIKSQILIKKQETRINTRRNTIKICQPITHGIRKRNNYSLSSSRNLTFKSTISTSTSSSRLDVRLNHIELQRAQPNFKINASGLLI